MSDSDVDTAQAGVPAPRGDRLTAARMAAGLTVAEAARQLKLSVAQIEALESGDYAQLPGPVFVRGFIRNYARLLKLDPAPLLEEIASQTAPVAPEAPEPARAAGIPFSGRRKFKWQFIAIGGLLVVAALAGYEFYGGLPAADGVDTRAVELPAPAIVTEGKPVEGEAATVPPAGAELTPAAPAATVPARSEIASPSKAPPDTLAPRAKKGAGDHVIRMIFSGNSWVEIRDRQGHKIFSQFNAAGTSHSVSGQPPFSLTVGNAKGVRVLHNDRPVDLAPHTQVDVARLTIE